MANRDEPQGFRPKGLAARGNYYLAAGTIFPGDAVKFDASGAVAVAAASDAWCGVSGSKVLAGEQCFVYDDPNQLFIGQADDTTIDAQTDIGLNYDLLATAGDSSYNVSRQEIDASTQATTATLPIKVLSIEPRTGNALGGFVDCVFKINNHQLGEGTGTAGV